MSAAIRIFPLVVLCTAGLAAQYKPTQTPVEYSATVQAVGELGAGSMIVKVHIDQFTEERERKILVEALRRNGYQAFLPAFKKAPVVGYLTIKDQKWDLRWASQDVLDLGQVVTVATSEPVFFAGGGQVDAKPRTGFEVAVMRIQVDTIGMGKGTFAPAARVKPNADATGVQIDDYGGEPLPVTMVTRVLK